MTLLLCIGFVVCALAAITDVLGGTIPNALTYPLLALAPALHATLALTSGAASGTALTQAGLSLLGIAACGVVPAFMWIKGALGGGDVKLFAGLGALLLPRFGLETELYILLIASLLAPAKLAYEGKLFHALGNIVQQALNIVRPKARRKALDPVMMTWFRLGPCFAIGVCVQLLLQWRAP